MPHDVLALSREPASYRAPEGPVGVIDIGSNSVRLVVFEGLRRNPVPIFNEKALCAIGRNLSSTGMLDEEGLKRARESLQRFCHLATAMKVSRLEVVATAAARDARNGPEFVAEASDICGVAVRILTGDEEARLAAQGVLCGIPHASGVVGDLGGGSLELVEVDQGGFGRSVTMPLGPLRLMDQSREKLSEARALVDAAFADVSWLRETNGRVLYVVGGAWRSLARVHMEQRNYPLHVLQNYEIKGDDALRVSRLVAGLGRKSLQSMTGVSKRRVETIPYGALVLERLMIAGNFSRVIVSAFGVREGLLYDLLDPEVQRRDPLLEAAREMGELYGRSPAHMCELIAWTSKILPDETPQERRLREAAAYLSDIDWRGHPDYRADDAFHTILRAPFAGIDHRERALLALCLYYRYGGGEEGQTSADALKTIAGNEHASRAAVIGAGLRLGHILSASSPGLLPRCPIGLENGELVLGLPSGLAALASETVRKRFASLASALDCPAHIEVGEE